MPGSIASVPESPQILIHVGSVGFLVFSLMMTAFGILNNAWIVLSREADEFQRGARGYDCFKTNKPTESIGCLPWAYQNKSDKFPEPFDKVENAGIIVNIGYYLACIILINQCFWLSYAIGLCCSFKFCERVVVHKLILFHVMITAVGVWILTFFIYVYLSYTSELIPQSLKNPEYTYHIGLGCWIFFLGGMIPFVGALYCLFGEETRRSTQRIQGIFGRHQPLEQHEMEDRAGNARP